MRKVLADHREALDLILRSEHGRLVAVRNGRYDSVPIDVVTSTSKLVDVARDYDTERLRPSYESFFDRPLMLISGQTPEED